MIHQPNPLRFRPLPDEAFEQDFQNPLAGGGVGLDAGRVQDLRRQVAAEEPHVGPYPAELMLCWLVWMTFPVARALGRSEKTAPFWTRAWWAKVGVPMKMAGRDPARRVMMGPCLARKERMADSNSEKFLRRNMKSPISGMVVGPGGRRDSLTPSPFVDHHGPPPYIVDLALSARRGHPVPLFDLSCLVSSPCRKLGVVVKPMQKSRLVLKFMWMEKNIGLALDQVIPGHGSIPLSPYYFWPRKDAWDELKILLESKPWISQRQTVILLNQATDVINLWQQSADDHS
ncbi:hypothetical protein RHMOL_Rhmol03G0248600 [Rhododendron molle]|uniref:Uncharacterized protein n=1 Tax=Rhododendron molle TaxID=49168 RepID=A0ACC0PJH5_RHOML|nr:hypothetical protein RHMOL_Rhmol03G0248600 [Rhododendron molle]